MRAARRMRCVAAGRAGDGDDDPLAGLPRCRSMPWPRCSRWRPSSTWSATHSSASSRSAARLPTPEVVAERGVDLLGRVDVAVGHAAAQRLGGHVDQLDLVGGPDDRVGHRLALLDAGDPLDHVVERLEVLDVDGGDHVDARRRAAPRRPASASRCGSRARWCGPARRRARPRAGGRGRRRRPSPRSVRRGTSIAPAGHDLEVAELRGGLGPAVGLDEADDDVGAALVAAPALVEHGEGLAHARRGAEVDAQLAAGHGVSLVELLDRRVRRGRG